MQILRRAKQRRGAVSVWFLVTAPTLVFLALMAVRTASLRHRQLELQTAVEAAVLAGTGELFDDVLLTAAQDANQVAAQRARNAAVAAAALNRVDSRAVRLDPNLENQASGDVILGSLRTFDDRVFDLETTPFNAVRVAVRRNGVAAAATAYLDRDVIGFQIQGSYAVGRGVDAIPSIPVVPLALPAAAWDEQIGRRRGADEYRMSNGQVVSGPDGLNEISLQVGRDGIRCVDVGAGSAAEAIRQLRTGVTYQDLQGPDYRGRLLLEDPSDAGSDPRNSRSMPELVLDGDRAEDLERGLQALIGLRRVWMLYSSSPAGESGRIEIVGFVAARLMHVQEGARIQIVLQPCTLITATAVTDVTRRDLGPRPLVNPYIARARLVE